MTSLHAKTKLACQYHPCISQAPLEPVVHPTTVHLRGTQVGEASGVWVSLSHSFGVIQIQGGYEVAWVHD